MSIWCDILSLVSDFSTFQGYYEEFMPKLYRYVASRVSGDRQMAEDLVSEIFMKALEHFEKYDKSYPFQAWLFGIARNHLIDHYKKNAKRKTSSLDEIENILPDNLDGPDKNAEKSLSASRIRDALAKLPPEKQELVTLRYLNGYSYAEMAMILGKEENAVKVATFRIVKQLQGTLSFYHTDSLQ